MAKSTKLTPSPGKFDASAQRMHVGPHARAIVAAFLILTSAEALAAPRMIGLGNRRRRAFPGPPSRAAQASARAMPRDAAGARAIRSGEQYGLNVIVVTHQQSLDRSDRPM
jgi:hypothetical protein